VKTLLVIDDEDNIRYSFQNIFTVDGTNVEVAASGREGLDVVRNRMPDVVVLDLQLPDLSGLEVFAEIHDFAPKLPVIIITAHGTTQTAIEAMKRGAFEYLVKPLDLDRLSQVLDRAFQAARLMSVPTALPAEGVPDQIVGRTAIMQEMCKAIGRIAPQDVNVLITGESGTGKELVARALYSHSRRADKPFVAVNCAAIPEQLLESELFGHEAGAYTGATRRRIGKFEQCGGGTLFLDEIGDMPASLQAKILRVLQEQCFERIGGNESIQTHVRVLAATNQDLPHLIEQGSFRKDLYYRLNAVTIKVPPLRQRLEDVSELAHFFLFRFCRELDMDMRGLAPEVLEKFQTYDWPGNVRELQGAIKQAMLNSSGHFILPEFLADSFDSSTTVTEAPVGESPNLSTLIDEMLRDSQGDLRERVVAAVERVLFTKVLEYTQGNQGKACEMLGLNRTTLRHRLRTLGLVLGKIPLPAPKGPVED